LFFLPFCPLPKLVAIEAKPNINGAGREEVEEREIREKVLLDGIDEN
jgi:hypothetical protein